MDFESVLDYAYETQHLKFHPRRFIDGVYNVIYENVFEAVRQLRDHFIEEKKAVASPEIIVMKSEFLFQELIKTLDKAVDKFELFVTRNLIEIPENIVLPEDKVHMDSCTKEQESILDQEIEELTREIIKEKVQKCVLREKKVEQKLVKAELEYMKEKLVEMSNFIKQCSFTEEALDVTVAECVELSKFIKERSQTF